MSNTQHGRGKGGVVKQQKQPNPPLTKEQIARINGFVIEIISNKKAKENK